MFDHGEVLYGLRSAGDVEGNSSTVAYERKEDVLRVCETQSYVSLKVRLRCGEDVRTESRRSSLAVGRSGDSSSSGTSAASDSFLAVAGDAGSAWWKRWVSERVNFIAKWCVRS